MHYPPERNQLPAHLTIFYALPPSAEAEVRSRLGEVARQRCPKATVAGMLDLGGGVAFRIVSSDLDRIREQLAGDLHGLLGAQDAGGWRPLLTLQNKGAPEDARPPRTTRGSGFVFRPPPIRGPRPPRHADRPVVDPGGLPGRS